VKWRTHHRASVALLEPSRLLPGPFVNRALAILAINDGATILLFSVVSAVTVAWLGAPNSGHETWTALRLAAMQEGLSLLVGALLGDESVDKQISAAAVSTIREAPAGRARTAGEPAQASTSPMAARLPLAHLLLINAVTSESALRLSLLC